MDRTELSLGKVINGEIRTFEVSIQNQGTAELEIEEVTTSCGCTQAEILPTIIAPNETGILRVRYDSGAHGPELSGTVLRQIFIASNDPDEPEVEFRFSAEILPPEL